MMGIPRKRSDSLLSDELAGLLAAAVCIDPAVATSESEPAGLSQSDRQALKRRVMARISDPAPQGTYTVRATDSPWRKVSELVEIRVVRTDSTRNNQTVLIRMLPGASIVPHPHTQDEECLVIEGAVEIGDHRLFEGDMHVASAGATHPRIVSHAGALLMIRSEIPPLGFRIA